MPISPRVVTVLLVFDLNGEHGVNDRLLEMYKITVKLIYNVSDTPLPSSSMSCPIPGSSGFYFSALPLDQIQ